MKQREEILAWLQGPRRFEEGVSLYRLHGYNRMLKQMFVRQGRTTATEQILVEEMRRLAGLTVHQLRALPRRALSSASKQKPSTPAVSQKQQVPSETTTKMIRFRERFPFLGDPSCPDVLKVVVADMFTAYGRYKEAHAALQSSPDDTVTAETARLAEEVVENYLQDRQLWAELEHYRDHGELLGQAPQVRRAIEAASISTLSDIDLLRQLQSAKTQQSKARTAVKAAAGDDERTARAEDQLVRWTLRRELLEEEAASRKKK